MLTPSIAQEIAQDTTAIIGFNVLITDRTGTVVGCGHADRVGSFHEASIEVVRTVRARSHDPEAASKLTGVKPGVTLPLVLNGEAVGTVGITGSPCQVEQFGRLVRNQTEILLRESVLLSSRLFREKAVENLVRDVALSDSEPDSLVFRARALGYELRHRRAAVVVDVDASADTAPVIRALRRVFRDPQDLIGNTGPGRFVVLHRIQGAGEALPDRCERTRDEIGVDSAVGIGGEARSVTELHDSYQDATTALHLAARLAGTAQVVHIDDLRVQELVASSGGRPRARFVRALVGELRTKPDWPVLRQTIIAWCECGFNLVRVAAELRVHRNTLAYRLNKIEELTGHSARDARFVLQLYLACIAEQLEQPRTPPGPRG